MRRRVALALVVALTGLLTGCGGASAPRGDPGCPPGLAAAAAQQLVIGGTPTADVQEVPAAELGQPAMQRLVEGDCVLRIRSIFRTDAPLVFQVLVPGGQAAADAIAMALVRDGWTPSQDITTGVRKLTGASDAVATIDRYTARDFATALPPRAIIPEGSAYAQNPVVLVGISLRVEQSARDSSG